MTTNQMTINSNCKMLKIVFFILITKWRYDILTLDRGGSSLPLFVYWILSIIILITAKSVPISKASCISADTTFFNSFIFFSIFLSFLLFYICFPPF